MVDCSALERCAYVFNIAIDSAIRFGVFAESSTLHLPGLVTCDRAWDVAIGCIRVAVVGAIQQAG